MEIKKKLIGTFSHMGDSLRFRLRAPEMEKLGGLSDAKSHMGPEGLKLFSKLGTPM